MARPSAEFAAVRRQILEPASPPRTVEAEIRELENEINNNQQPLSALLMRVVERIGSITLADGAAIAVCDQWGVVCRASTGDAPELGSRLRSDSALTRECFETGQTVLCEDTETDYRVHRSTAKSLRLRSAAVVPLRAQDSVLGVIEVLSSRPSAFDAALVAGLQRIAELLAHALSPAPVQPERLGSVWDIPLASPEEPEQIAPAMVPAPADAAEPKSRLNVFALAGAVFLLFLLSLMLWAALRRPPHAREPSAPAVIPGSSAKTASEPATQPPEVRPDAPEAQHLESGQLSPLDTGAPASLPSPSNRPSQPEAESAATPPVNTPVAESPAAQILRPVIPALIIQGTPPGTQIIVDDQMLASTNPAGQASVSMLAEGQHRLRLKLNGYRDYDQRIDVQAGRTSTITTKLDPLDLPALSGPTTAPVLAVAPALPAPVIAIRPSPPDFVLTRTLKAHASWVTTVAFSPDGQRLASGSWDRTVKFWEVSSGAQLSTVSSKMKEVQALAFSRDGRWLATENAMDTAALRDPMTGQEIRALPSDKPVGALGSNWVYSIAFSPDGQWLASGIDDKTVRLWEVKTGRKVRDLAGLRRPVTYIAFSPDGQSLATGDDEKTIRIWDVSSGEELYKLSGHKKPVYAVAFSPKGRWLASASADKTLKLWDLATGHELHTLAGHGSVVTSLAFSPDGRWLVSGSWDKTIKVWDVETGREVQTLTGHDHPVYSVAFDSRGRWLASGSEDGTIKLWRLADTAGQSGSRQ